MSEHAAGDGLQLALPPELHPLVRLILARPELQEQLGAIRAPHEFVAAAMVSAADHSVACDETTLRAVLRPDPLGLGRFAPTPLTMDCWPPPGWLPARSVPTGGAPAFDWLWFGSRPLTAPFFEDEVRRASALPLNWLLRIRTSLDVVVAGAAAEPGLPLAGLIFHMSRCGSTLLAQMLAALPGHAVSSEPEPLDAVLRWSAAIGLDRADTAAALRAIVAALGRRRSESQQRQFIKLEVWHSLFLPQLRRAFPDVNWVYLHRDPREVLVSLAEQPSLHVLPGTLDAALLGFDGADTAPADYAARVIGRSSQAVLDHWSLGGGLVIDYPDLRSAATGEVPEHFGLRLHTPDRAVMAVAGARDAKAPDRPFSPDSASKRAAASPELRMAATNWIEPVRRQLLQLR